MLRKFRGKSQFYRMQTNLQQRTECSSSAYNSDSALHEDARTAALRRAGQGRQQMQPPSSPMSPSPSLAVAERFFKSGCITGLQQWAIPLLEKASKLS
jgi:hypothetical protein